MADPPTVPFAATLHVRDACLCLHIQRAARVLARRFDEALRPVGLTNEQFSLLMSLNRPEPPTMGTVAALLMMDRTTLTAALKPLERRGLVQVRADPADKRSRRLALTADGTELLAKAVPIWEGNHAVLEAQLDDSDPIRFRNSLQAISSQNEVSASAPRSSRPASARSGSAGSTGSV
jgi:DNA-binding MarR family transcriptional regulator